MRGCARARTAGSSKAWLREGKFDFVRTERLMAAGSCRRLADHASGKNANADENRANNILIFGAEPPAHLEMG
jgi:hypothetical protein